MTPIRILIVDDEQAFAAALAERLVGRGHRATYVLNGEAALRALGEDPSIDVILLDVVLPGIDGLTLLTRIKSDNPLIEIFMLTAHATVAAAVEAVRAGASDYLIKPCDFENLIARVEAAGRRKRKRTEQVRDVRMRPYLTEREKKACIDRILSS
jgi:DNA-binding response OmpR family regulator